MVPDTTLDPRLLDHPFVTGLPHLHFYSGAPIISDEGFSLGTVCILDPDPWDGASLDPSVLTHFALLVQRAA